MLGPICVTFGPVSVEMTLCLQTHREIAIAKAGRSKQQDTQVLLQLAEDGLGACPVGQGNLQPLVSKEFLAKTHSNASERHQVGPQHRALRSQASSSKLGGYPIFVGYGLRKGNGGSTSPPKQDTQRGEGSLNQDTHTNTHTHIHIYTYIHIYTHTHTHTHL